MNNYFCVLPFFGAEYSPNAPVTACCLLPTGHDINQIRDKMLRGQRPDACSRCWDLENAGVTSDRQQKNSSFDFYTDRDIKLVEQDCREGKFSQQIVKLYTSNLCNSTCVTCGPTLSTSWGTLTKNTKLVNLTTTELGSIDYKNVAMLTFVGGEPLYEKENFNVLTALIDAGNTGCFISMVTNTSVTLNHKQIDILKQFKNLNLCLSIDGIGPVFEYVRYPLKWNTLLTNLEQYRSLCNDISVSYTISNLNILYYKETTDWFTQQGLNYNHNVVRYPSWFSPDALPKIVKESVSAVPIDLGPHTIQHEKDFENFCEVIKHQDQIKKISIQDYLPKVYNIIKSRQC